MTKTTDNIAYYQAPGPRNQDVVRISKLAPEITVACIVDGWNSKDLGTDEPGRQFATRVAERFPKIFLSYKINNPQKKAKIATEAMDKEMLAKYPRDVSCVGSFLFLLPGQDILVTIGSVFVLVWNGKLWYRPKEIGDYSLSPQKFPSDVSRFIGRGELKNDPFYSATPDVIASPTGKKIFIASDGLEDLFTVAEFNQWAENQLVGKPKLFVNHLFAEIQRRQFRQKDDVSILLKS